LVQTDEYMRFRPSAFQAPWSVKPKDRPKRSLIYDPFYVFDSGSHGIEYYERILPDQFDSTGKDDLLMRSIIEKYAIEGKDEDS